MVGIKETRCRNCDGILFIGSFSQDQENQILDSFDTPPELELEYDGVVGQRQADSQGPFAPWTPTVTRGFLLTASGR